MESRKGVNVNARNQAAPRKCIRSKSLDLIGQIQQNDLITSLMTEVPII